jgi:hypothetical protein
MDDGLGIGGHGGWEFRNLPRRVGQRLGQGMGVSVRREVGGREMGEIGRVRDREKRESGRRDDSKVRR